MNAPRVLIPLFRSFILIVNEITTDPTFKSVLIPLFRSFILIGLEKQMKEQEPLFLS